MRRKIDVELGWKSNVAPGAPTTPYGYAHENHEMVRITVGCTYTLSLSNTPPSCYIHTLKSLIKNGVFGEEAFESLLHFLLK